MKKLLLFFLLFPLIFAPFFLSKTFATPVRRVTICHATSSQVNPYVRITVNANGAVSGHNIHSNDIIPPFEYFINSQPPQQIGQYPGKNWDQEGQDIYNNECDHLIPTLSPTTTPIPSGSPSPSPTNTPTPTPTCPHHDYGNYCMISNKIYSTNNTGWNKIKNNTSDYSNISTGNSNTKINTSSSCGFNIIKTKSNDNKKIDIKINNNGSSSNNSVDINAKNSLKILQ